MKINFLYRNALPRRADVFLKILTTITALLCSQLIVYGQPTQNLPLDGANVAAPIELQWTTNTTQGVDIEVYECLSSSTNSIELGAYELVCDPIVIGNVLEDLSGITYNSLTNELYIVRNGTPTVYRTDLLGNLKETIPLTDFEDTEGIVHIGGTQYAVAEERRGRITFFDIENVSYSNTVQLPDGSPGWSWEPTNNKGLEGVTYNPAGNGTIHTIKEKNPKGYYSFSKPTSFPVGLNSVNTPCDIANAPFGFSDVAGIHHLGLNGLGLDNHILLLSEENKALVEADGCTEISRLNLTAGGANGTLNTAVPQPEGVTMDDNGNLYIVSEPNLLYIFSKRPSGTLIHNASAVTGNSYEIPTQLQINTDYCWRIKNSEECLWSPLSSFTPAVSGCTDSNACNYDASATLDDGSCLLATGCDECDGNGGVTNNPDTGASCDDGDDCTTNDLIDANCNCAGTFQDTDGDSVCDTNDQCHGTDDSVIGTACNDNDACTSGDTFDSNCNCAGTFQDTDGDSVCDANDQCPGGDDTVDLNNNGIPDACEDACPTDLIITNNDVPGDYEASYSIETDETANVVVNLGDQLTLSAGRYVELHQGFDAKPGANFHAYIEGCTTTNPKVESTDLSSVRHYPNPFTNRVTLEFNLDKDAETSITIIDITGKVIHQNPSQQLTSGNQNINLNTNDWTPGTYFYQVFIKENNTGITKRANGALVKM